MDRGKLGEYLRARREALQAAHGRTAYSLQAVASKAGVSKMFLSLVERGESAASDEVLVKLAQALGEDIELLRVFAGRVPDDVMEALQRKQKLLQLIRELSDAPDDRIDDVIRYVQVRDGEW